MSSEKEPIGAQMAEGCCHPFVTFFFFVQKKQQIPHFFPQFFLVNPRGGSWVAEVVQAADRWETTLVEVIGKIRIERPQGNKSETSNKHRTLLSLFFLFLGWVEVLNFAVEF